MTALAVSLHDRPGQEGSRVPLILLLVFFIAVLVRTAWIAEGAFLELRTVVNAVSGYGLRWNVDERVQTFTDPMWILLLAGFDLVVRQTYVTVMSVSFVSAVGAAALVAGAIAVDAAAAVVALSLLICSKAFVEFCTSGFSTPLTFLLIAAFWALYWRGGRVGRHVRALSLLVGLLLLTDWTATLLVIPALAYVLRSRHEPLVPTVLPGAVPVLAWIAFATVYYGTPVPAPLVAAWHSNWTLRDALAGGVAYALDLADNDPLTVMAMFSAPMIAARIDAPERLDAKRVVAGLAGYVAWLGVSGGDPLSGRAFAPALLTAAIVVARFRWLRVGGALAGVLAGIAALALVAPRPALVSDATYGSAGERLSVPWPGTPPAISPARQAISDGRWQSYPISGLMVAQRRGPVPALGAFERAVQRAADAHESVVVGDHLEPLAYAAGARLHLVDLEGDTDPLIARLPASGTWRPGHAVRTLPPAYVEHLKSGTDLTEHPRLAGCERSLALLTRAPLADPDRLRAMVSVNFGAVCTGL